MKTETMCGIRSVTEDVKARPQMQGAGRTRMKMRWSVRVVPNLEGSAAAGGWPIEAG